MSKNIPANGYLTVRQLIISSRNKGLPTPSNHLEWILNNDFVEPAISVQGVNFYNEYQIYLLDKIEGYRQDSLKTPRTMKGIAVNWQEYLLDNKAEIINLGKKWQSISELLLDIQLMQNEMLTQSLKNKDSFNKGSDLKVTLRETLQVLSMDADFIKPQEIMNKYDDLSEDTIRYWTNNVLPVQVFKNNPAFQLFRKDQTILKQFKEKELQMSKTFILGNPVQLSNFYISMISYLNFFLDCLNKQKLSDIHHIFTHEQEPRECAICHESFISKVKGGRKQKLCGKSACDRELRKRLAEERRKCNKAY